jgi:hypothetical protein
MAAPRPVPPLEPANCGTADAGGAISSASPSDLGAHFLDFGAPLGRQPPLDSSPENRKEEESNNLGALGGKQIDDLLNGFVGAVVGGFEFARWLVSGIGAVMEAAVGEGSAKPFVEEEEQQRYLDSFWREAVGVAGAVAL